MLNGKALGIYLYLTFIFCSYIHWEYHNDPKAVLAGTPGYNLSVTYIPEILDFLFKLGSKHIERNIDLLESTSFCEERLILNCNNTDNTIILESWLDSLNSIIEYPTDSISIHDFNLSVLENYCDSQISFEFDITEQQKCIGVIQLTDNTGPKIQCDSILTVYSNAQNWGKELTTYLDGLIVQDCNPYHLYSSIDPDNLSIECFPDTILDLTIFGVDDCGNRSDCQTFLSVIDTFHVALICPENLMLDCSLNDSESRINEWLNSVYLSQDYDEYTISINHTLLNLEDQSCYSENSIEWFTTDPCGYSYNCSAQIVISDSVPPEINCPETIRVETTDLKIEFQDLLVLANPEVYDICNDYTIEVSFANPLSISNCDTLVYVDLITNAVDVCSNESECITEVLISRPIQPEIKCPNQLEIDCQNNNLELQLDNWIKSAKAWDYNNQSLEVFIKPEYDNLDLKGCDTIYAMRFYTQDACLYRADCTSFIKLVDTTAPEIECPTPLNIDMSKQFELELEEWTNTIQIIEECNDFEVIDDIPDLNAISECQDSIEVIFSVTDICDNTSTCTSTINIFQDHTLEVNCPERWILKCLDYNDADVFDELIETIQVQSSLNYELYWEISQAVSEEECDGKVDEILQFTLIDICGNRDYCSTIIQWNPELQIYIPNIISAKAESPNNAFMVFSNQDDVVIKEMLIYNKWGNLVFEKYGFPANNIDYSWKGESTDTGNSTTVYTYMVIIEDSYGEKTQYIGTISLLN